MLTKGVVTLALVNHMFNMENMQEKKARSSRNRWANLTEDEERRRAKKVPRPSTVPPPKVTMEHIVYKGRPTGIYYCYWS